jgi:hypothetical protein
VGIARAEDKSGNGRNFTEGTSGNRPTWTSGVQNGFGVARYDGGDRLTSVAAASTWTFLHSTQSTIFAVIRNDTTSSPNAVYGWFGTNAATSANRGVFYAYDNRNAITGLTNALNCLNSGDAASQPFSGINNAGNAVVTEFRNIFSANVFQINTITTNPASATLSARVKLSVNGGSLVGNNERSGTLSTSAPTFNLQIGASGNNVAPLTGDFCELIILNSLASTDTRQTAEGYLAHKWGLAGSLPNDHPYKNAAPGASETRRRRDLGGYGL